MIIRKWMAGWLDLEDTQQGCLRDMDSWRRPLSLVTPDRALNYRGKKLVQCAVASIYLPTKGGVPFIFVAKEGK